jgi:hypothetical protein
VTYSLNEWRNEQWSSTLESLDSEDQSLWKMTKRKTGITTPSPPLQVPAGLAVSDSKKAEALADSLEDQSQPVNIPSEQAVIEMVNGTMRAYECASVSAPKLTSPSNVL